MKTSFNLPYFLLHSKTAQTVLRMSLFLVLAAVIVLMFPRYNTNSAITTRSANPGATTF